MNGKTMVQNMSFNNYGLVINGKILGTEVTLREVFKRVTPQISGYYIYESEVRNINSFTGSFILCGPVSSRHQHDIFRLVSRV